MKAVVRWAYRKVKQTVTDQYFGSMPLSRMMKIKKQQNKHTYGT